MENKRVAALAIFMLVVLGFVIVLARRSATTLGVTGLFNVATTSESSVQLRDLEQQLTRLSDERDDLARQLETQRRLNRVSIAISELPSSLQRPTPADSLREIERSVTELEAIQQSPYVAYALLEKYIQYEGHVLRPPTARQPDAEESALLGALARVMFHLGYTEDAQSWTTDSLVVMVQKLQSDSGLKADGRIGRNTWAAISRRFLAANQG